MKMGKQRATTKAKEENDSRHLDTILAILDLCGFYDDVTCPRRILIDALEALRVRYSRHVWWDDESLKETTTILQEFLQLEELMAKVWDLMTRYETTLNDDFAELVELQTNAVPASWNYMYEALCYSYKSQHKRETVALRNLILAFDRMYTRPDDPNDTSSVDHCLASTIQCLDRYGLLHRVDFQELVAICHQSPAGTLPSLSQNEHPATVTEHMAGAVSSQVSQTVSSADNVLDAVRCFIGEARDTTSTMSSWFTTLLVIGSEGAGKTHLCDQVSSLANEASCPGNYKQNCSC